MRHWADEVDWIVPDECENGAGAEDEHQCDDGRSDDDRAANVAGRRARFAGQDRDVLKSAQCADRELAENIEAIKKRHGGQG